jgi:hypothetical protein
MPNSFLTELNKRLDGRLQSQGCDKTYISQIYISCVKPDLLSGNYQMQIMTNQVENQPLPSTNSDLKWLLISQNIGYHSTNDTAKA